MVRSIFFKPDRREENALTHWFLGIYERLSDDGRYLLLKNCQVDYIHELGKPKVIEEQPQLGNRYPDGLLVFLDTVVVFENKLDTVHKSEENIELSQLGYYYNHLETKYPGYNHRILVTADDRYQNRRDIMSIIDKLSIPEEHVDIIFWQELHHSCVVWDKFRTSSEDAKSLQTTELDRFLVEELRILLEEMKMVTYTGIELEDLEGYARSRSQLRVLEDYLTKEIHSEFDKMLKRYNLRLYGSILYNYLGFGLNNDWKSVKRKARLYVSILSRDRSFKIFVRIRTREVTSKLQGEDLEKFVSLVNQLNGFTVLIGSKLEDVDLSKRLLKFKSGNFKTDDFFDGYLKLEKRFSFEEAQKELGLNTPMFPQNLMKEIVELKPIIILMNQVLTNK